MHIFGTKQRCVNNAKSHWCKPFSQWLCSFQMKAALPLAKKLVAAGYFLSETDLCIDITLWNQGIYDRVTPPPEGRAVQEEAMKEAMNNWWVDSFTVSLHSICLCSNLKLEKLLVLQWFKDKLKHKIRKSSKSSQSSLKLVSLGPWEWP